MSFYITTLMILILLWGWIDHKNRILSFCIISIFFIAVCFSYDEYDYLNYKDMYELSLVQNYATGYEILYDIMFRISNKIGLSYNQLRIVVTVFEIILIHSTIRKYCKCTPFVWAMFLVYPGWLLITSFRFTLGLSIAVFGIRYLVENRDFLQESSRKQKLKDSIKYLLCIIIASGFHNATYFFLTFLMLKWVDIKKIIISFLITFVLFSSLASIDSIFTIASAIPFRESFEADLMGFSRRNFNGIAYNILRQGLVFFLGWISSHYYFLESKDKVQTEAQDGFMKMVIPLNCTSLFFLLFSLFSSNVRASYYTVIINLISLGICIDISQENRNVILLLKNVALCSVAFLTALACTLDSSETFEMILKMVYETNIVINAFN